MFFGMGKEDGKRISGRLGHTLLDEHEKLRPGRLELRSKYNNGGYSRRQLLVSLYICSADFKTLLVDPNGR